MPRWLRESFNALRPPGRLGIIARVADTPEQDDQWHSWDFTLEPGRYRLAVTAIDSQFLNFFCVGTVPFENQPEPIKKADRFGPPLSNLRYFPHMPLQHVDFDVADAVIRVESWARPVPEQMNPSPLPPGYGHWSTFVERDGLGVTRMVLHDLDVFGFDFQSVSRRRFTDNSIIFGAEDGGDNDFNDLMVELTKL